MFVKAKKWLSWLLAVTIVAGLIPFNTLSAFAASSNPTLESAMNTISNKQALTVVLSGKEIVGKVELADIREHFPRVERVNLSGNFITKIVANDTHSPAMTVVNESNNLLLTQRTFQYSSADPIQRLKYAPTEINVSDLFAQINHSKGTLQSLIDKGVIESIRYDFASGGTTVSREVSSGSWDTAVILATEVGALDPGSVLTLYAKFTGEDAGDPPTRIADKSLALLDAEITVEGMPSRMYSGISEATVTITKMPPSLTGNTTPLQFQNVNEVSIDPNPAVVPSSDFVVNKTLTPDGKIIAKIKFAQPYGPGAVDFELVSNNFKVSKSVEVVAANFDGVRLIEKNAIGDAALQQVENTSGTTVQAPKMYTMKGTAVSSWNTARFDARKTNLQEGRYYVEIREGGVWKPLKTEEISLVQLNPSAGLDASFGDDNGNAYLRVSTTFDATITGASNIEVGVNTHKINLTFYPPDELQPEGFYIYAFAPNAGQAAMDQAIRENPSPYYVASTPGAPQDQIKLDNPFELKEGESKKFLPVAKYTINGQEVRRFVPGSSVSKTFYQRERTQQSFNFDNNFKNIEANSTFKYNLNSDGYPVSGTGNVAYKGAPIQARTAGTPYGTAVELKAVGMSTINPQDKFANIVLAMSGSSNPVGFWFQVNWIPKKVSDYVLVRDSYTFPGNPDLKSDDLVAPGQTFKQNLEAELAQVDTNAAILNPATLKLDNKQTIKLPIGTNASYKLLVIYDNGMVEEVSDAATKLELEAVSGTDFETGDISVDATGDPLLSTSVVKVFATENGGVDERERFFTDKKIGRTAELKVTGYEAIAELSLTASQITGFGFIANDELRIKTNPTDPRVTGGISSGKWHGQFDVLGLGSDTGTNPVIVNQGNGSYNDKLKPKMFVIPVYTNKDLTIKKVANITTLDNLDATNLEKVRKLAWISNDWSTEANKPVSVSQTAGSSLFIPGTNDDPSKMGYVGQDFSIKFTLDAGTTLLNNHPVIIDPANREKDIPFKVEEPIYDRIGVIGEEIATGNKLDLQNNDETNGFEVGVGVPAAIKIRLTNSNLFAMEALALGGDKFLNGVYFVGDGTENSGVYNYRVEHDNPNTVTTERDATKYKDLAILALASGLKSNLSPSTYVDPAQTPDEYAAGAGVNRMALLNSEFDKIKPVVYKAENGTFTVTNEVEVVPYRSGATLSFMDIPGAYRVTASKRGEYYVTFVTEQNGVQSPLVPVGTTEVENQANYDAGKPAYFFKINVTKSPLAKLYNYVPNETNVTVEANGKIRVGPLSGGVQRAEFDIYPVVVDTIIEKAFTDAGYALPDRLDAEGQQRFKDVTGSTFAELLANPNSGVSYIKSDSFNPLTATDFLAPASTHVGASLETEPDSSDPSVLIYKQHIVVQKAEIASELVGINAQPGDFNDVVGGAPARLVKTGAGAKFIAAATPLTALNGDIYQNLNEILQDIVTDPNNATVGINNTVIFNVKYKTNRGTEIAITEDSFKTVNTGQPGYLEITPDSNNPEQLVPIKKAADGGIAATLSFVPSKIGEYTFYLKTTNELGGIIPALHSEGHPIRFTVEPYIKAHYELYHKQIQTIEVNTGDPNDVLTYEPDSTGTGILDAAELANGKLKLDETWATDENNVVTMFTVTVKRGADTIGTFTVNAHPRGHVIRYEIVPETTDTNRYEVSDTDTFTVRVRGIYADGSFEYIDLDANNIVFDDGSDDSYSTMLNDSFLTFTNQDPQTVLATVSRPAVATADRDWIGEWTVFNNPLGSPLKLYSRLKTGPVSRPAQVLKVYELKGTTLEDVTGKAPENNILHLLSPETRTLYVVDEADSSSLKVINDYSLLLTAPNVSTRQLAGNTPGTAPQIIGSTAQILTNPTDFARLEVSPVSQGDVTLNFTSADGTANADTSYRILQGQPLVVTIVGSLDRTVMENDPVQIQAVVTGGVSPTLQWQESDDNSTFTDVTGQNTTVLDITAVATPAVKYYRLKAESGVDVAYSQAVKVTVTPAPTAVTGSIQVVGAPIVGSPLTLRAVLNGLQPGDTPTFRWRSRNPVTNAVQFLTPVNNSPNYDIPSVTADMFNLEYYVTVQVNGQTLNLGPATLSSGGTYTVTFNPGAGSIASGNANIVVAPNTVLTNAQIPTLNAPAGQVFNAWTPSNPNGHTVVGDITFTATYRTPSSGGGGSGGSGGSTPAPTPATPTVPTTPVQKGPVAELNKDYKLAYIKGYPDGTVRPNAAITRAEVSAIFARISKKQMVEGQSYSSSFRDVPAGKWYSNFIGFLEADRILTGYPDGTFKPNNRITRAEFATIISKFAELKGGNASFNDVRTNHWAKSYIDNAVAHGWMNGYPDGTFKPDQAITRAEVVTVINKLIERTPNKAQIDAEVGTTPKYSDLAKTFWAYYDVIEASTNR